MLELVKEINKNDLFAPFLGLSFFFKKVLIEFQLHCRGKIGCAYTQRHINWIY